MLTVVVVGVGGIVSDVGVGAVIVSSTHVCYVVVFLRECNVRLLVLLVVMC